MIDFPNEHDIVAMFAYRSRMELLFAAINGRGFVVDGEEAVAQTHAGKQVLSPGEVRSLGFACTPRPRVIGGMSSSLTISILLLSPTRAMASPPSASRSGTGRAGSPIAK